jgi:hypothetical protein
MSELEAFYPLTASWKSFRGVTSTDPDVDTRDPIYWPHPADSIWNMPIGVDAELVPLGFNYLGDTNNQNSRVTVAEENILFLDPDAPLAYIMEHDAGWTGAIRCSSRTGDILQGNGSVSPMPQLPIATGWSTQPYVGSRPNMSGALVYRDGTDLKLFETQPLHFCDDGVAVSQFVNDSWVGDSLITGGMGAANANGSGGKGGSHGGSYMTAFGGTIRLGEIVPGGAIKHAMKLTMDTGWYCSSALAPNAPDSVRRGHMWPALKADNGWDGTYGNLNPSISPYAKMGMLITTNNTFNPESMITEPAKIIARALKNYGAYLVDGDYAASVPHLCQWQVERSNEGAFTTEFFNEWGYQFFHQTSLHGSAANNQMQFRTDIGNLMENTYIVTDNSPTNVGGAGARRAPLAPALEI